MDAGILAPWHWAILIAIVMLVFGPRKLPELGSSLGKGIRGFKEGLRDVEDEVKSSMAEATAEDQPLLAVAATTDAGTAGTGGPVGESIPEAEPAGDM